jgi:hypothetical protein
MVSSRFRDGIRSLVAGYSYSDLAGEGSVVAAEMAAADFKAQNPDFDIRVLSAELIISRFFSRTIWCTASATEENGTSSTTSRSSRSDLRHLGARQRHRRGDGAEWRRHLVLHHRRLRLRQA